MDPVTPRPLPRSLTRRTRAARLALLALSLLTTALLVWSPPVGAHSDEGELTIVRAEPAGPMTIAIEVGIVYPDGHLAETAEVWVNASTPGTALEPVGLAHQGGEGSAVYAGEITVPAPGDWTLLVESASPTASATTTVSVEPDATTVPSTSTPAPGATDAPTDVEDPAGTATETTAQVSLDAVDPSADDEDGGTGWLLPALVTAAVALLGVGVYAASRRRNAAEG